MSQGSGKLSGCRYLLGFEQSLFLSPGHLLHSPAFGDIGVRLQHRTGAMRGPVQYFPAKHDHAPAIARGVYQLALPILFPRKLVVDLLQRFRELGLQQCMDVLPQGLIAGPAVEALRAPAPIEYATLEVTH